ncbi:hypothetical protein NDU88_004555 [Pleurodeles waltl]|uniref:Uncharacterized protein n=1 Tax=Pleurodeles waltl TaxID=8319 RepID=A0AAV7WVF1_PLEWA|nr:hypothetical protein NDU88_004555 [Pleurodeles waltl]
MVQGSGGSNRGTGTPYRGGSVGQHVARAPYTRGRLAAAMAVAAQRRARGGSLPLLLVANLRPDIQLFYEDSVSFMRIPCRFVG